MEFQVAYGADELGQTRLPLTNPSPAVRPSLPAQSWPVETRLEPTRSGGADIEVAITRRFHTEKHRNQQPYEQEWEGRRLRARKGRRPRDAHRDNRPIGRVVEPRSPD